MRSTNFAGSFFPSHRSQIMMPVESAIGSLRVCPDSDAGTNRLVLTVDGLDEELASHANGFSCRELLDRLMKKQGDRVLAQADFIVRCGGRVKLDRIAELVRLIEVPAEPDTIWSQGLLDVAGVS